MEALASSKQDGCQGVISKAQPHHPPMVVYPPPRQHTSFLSLPYELRLQIYRLILRALPGARPMRCYTRPIDIYHLQNLDPRPLFAHPQIQHEIEALLARRSRIQVPAMLGHESGSLLSGPTRLWLQERVVEFNCVRVWSTLPVPIILDMNSFKTADGDDDDEVVTVNYRWRWRRCRYRIYFWGQRILDPALPVMIEYLAAGLRKRVGERHRQGGGGNGAGGGGGMGIRELDFLAESMGRFRDWYAVHNSLRCGDPRLPSGCYEEQLAGCRWVNRREEFRRHLRWWDEVEAEVRGLKLP